MERNDLLAWISGFIALVMVVALPVSCSVHKSSKMAEAIKDGIDPIKARCAFEGVGGAEGSAVTCAISAMKEAQK